LETFRHVNREYKKLLEINNKEKSSGSTCSLVVIEGNKCFSCNAGDSRTIIIRKDKIIFQTLDHNPSTEKERLEKLDVRIMRGRVWGVLSLSRAFGDFEYNGVICDPDISIINLEEGDLIHICSDGVSNECFDSTNILDIILNKRKSYPLEYVNTLIANESLDSHGDNSSSILVNIQRIREERREIFFIPYYTLSQSFENFVRFSRFNINDVKKYRKELIEKRNVVTEEYQEDILVYSYTGSSSRIERRNSNCLEDFAFDGAGLEFYEKSLFDEYVNLCISQP
jgi:serine/threonine protein phosphatase PrpC